jgi:hypothetical protein
MLILTEIKNAGLTGVSPLTKVYNAEIRRNKKPDRCITTGRTNQHRNHRAKSNAK